jgi:hypothetical protein
MNTALPSVRRLQLEPLESRTLLAGAGFDEALAQVAPAIKGTGEFSVAFSERIGQSELFITGPHSGSLAINFDLLPAFITAVTVRNFDTVTFTGVDQLKKLVASDIKTLDADNISVGVGLYATNVQSVSLAAGGEIAVLNGSASRIEIASLQQTLIISDLQHLAISSKTPSISIVSLNAGQIVTMLYQADLVSVAGIADKNQQVKFLPAGTAIETGGTVVTVTPSERTSEFIARIRELLRNNDLANPLSVFESLGYTEMNLLESPGTTAAHLHQNLEQVAIETSLPVEIEAESFPDVSPSLDLVEFDLSSLSELKMDTDFADVFAETDSQWLIDDAQLQTFIQPASAQTPTTPRASADALVTAEDREVFMETLQSDMRTLKDIVIEGIAGEITPGERTAFLLVDPKPTRSAADRHRDSALWSDAVSRGETS